MLVLTRKPKQTITLHLPDGDVIKVVLLNIDRNQVRIGIDARPEVTILRDDAKTTRVP